MKSALIITLLAALAAFTAARGPLNPEDIAEYTFERYVKEFRKGYAIGSEEFTMRRALFESRKIDIMAHNMAGRSWTRTINKFADWTEEERKTLRGYRHPDPNGWHTAYKHDHELTGAAIAESRDYKPLLTGIKDQGQCGSCYAHSATESVETYLYMATGDRAVLSQQQGADCTTNPGDCGGSGGCSGGTAEIVTASFVTTGGIASDWTYPYTLYWGPATPKCRYNDTAAPPAGTFAVAKVDGYVAVGVNNYTAQMDAISNVGPLSISVDAAAWPDYHSGVYDGCSADTIALDHAVQLIGYGTDATTGLAYWTVRNSWGVDYGEEGYIRVRRHLNTASDPTPCGMDTSPADGPGCKNGPPAIKVCGSCGILYSPFYPLNARHA